MTHAPAPRIQLLLVDDHNLFRRGLRALLSQDERFEVVCEAGDIGEALRCLAQTPRPDVILLDNHLPGVRGVDAIPALKDAAPGTRILMLTVSENEDDLAAALRAGADGYLLKTVESDQLAETIVKVLDGESVISPEMLTKLVSVFRARPAETAPAPLEPASGPSPDLLSPREREILLLIARGDSNKLIARALDIAETTVKIHVQHILRKLGLSSRVQAAVYATSRGLA
ncbi:MAG TPA: DNA-binding response regulator [Hydrogenophaga sp.]|jgi:two-component system nitrate/nitrite response regulator NarL|uniref:response regulator n=1 Tax=Hydrogenophaga sp. TaxID=1904254 RepID=UPI0008C81306|nr:response regulator transcription factor [Hydrogenophaga sp.]MBU4181291.1 response regulator transcription factor [Gammaproteobacteria bacterium]OGA77693.1 MAG: DNA-binding response regulator [Burkholderiales bacterium GWE1_65_30]OGA89721.1 MAG: DNA-binding response regulator [Burkholderiales bacterium GWF1_66_17]OGB32107.1 MAG: DNA-binding response regulator [Burkholderiales bacterium RIFCSPHIGHO2_02_FULL_66_10]PKO75384.1 MAG: DNA-binding response regulator [Betaproteobacteria bacterium HGW